MYIAYFFLTFSLSIFFTFIVALTMRHFGVVDKVKRERRKIHKRTVPLGGGLAIFVSTFFVIGFVLTVGGHFENDIVLRNLIGLFIGGLILMIGGFLDDKYNLRPRYQILFPVAASFAVIGFGIGPHLITSPFGGTFDLAQWKIQIDGLGSWVVLADFLVFFWLMGMMFTTKFLDGLDGLVAGIVSIGAFVIFFLALQNQWYQPDVALLSIIFAGATLGFLIWNWHPAKIFLGEGGSLFAGFMLGSLAIISGGKIATTLLVVAIPVLDLIRVIIRRIQKKKPVYVGDNEHLHFRLLESGFNQKQAVFLLYAIALLFGISALFLQSSQKLMALIFLFILMLLTGVWFSRKDSGKS
jgi:UDP-GlcNAc:undecaprenyl-phosphate/decaprenyl-phosphate GlcNAc-1-phosphate transferase